MAAPTNYDQTNDWLAEVGRLTQELINLLKAGIDVGQSGTLGNLALINDLSSAPVGNLASLLSALTLSNVADRGVVGGVNSDLIAIGGLGLGSVGRDIRSGESVNFKGLGRGIYGIDRPVTDTVTGAPSYSPGAEYAAHLPINLSSPGSSTNSILSFFPTSKRVVYGVNSGGTTDPADYEPFELLHHKRILGAVAFANGFPSGALFESGQNANGFYLKFANGTLICYGNKSVNFNIDAAYGALYASGFTETITFPHPFLGAPYGLDTTVADGSGTRGALFSIKPASPLETSVAIRAIAVSMLTAAQFNVSYLAIGNWRAL
ncbi:hypothetical protein [Halomonas sp. Cn5-12]|uniref:hypothetical protein n=1 Tax=Halomonas sp. Cn5-12 TaxID=2908885 RepID=UPI001F1F1B96|nr:hypothetical protein [Halomonas sp. Cn5-12]MCF2913382.1 hypothetical protein [Halomonas sp. Cn5-12]